MAQPKSKRVIKIILFLGTLISMFYVPWPIVIAWIKPLPSTIQEQVDAVADYGFDGIIVYVDQKGEKPAFYTAGYKNKESKTPADPKSLFKIASVNKLFTAVAIAKLTRDGRLSLDKTLGDYFPELSGRIAHADQITIRMMVQHRSGIPNYTDTPDYWVHPKDSDEERLALVLDLPAKFEPDTDYAYSNTNYLLLAQLIARITGDSEFAYIQKEILDPLSLKHTYASVHEVNMDDVMSGYYVGYPHDLKTQDVGMLATADDLGKFIRALNDGSVFKDRKEQDIYSSIYEFGHTGLVPGYQTIAKYDQDLDAVVIQFTNTVNFQGYNWNMSEVMYSRILKILRKKE
ncbi:serine hydrolase domain-containing protein [Dyadobacter jejuensis]|nr:serine hydrolase domain-containing protein [Dyadobacter jejuensis]